MNSDSLPTSLKACQGKKAACSQFLYNGKKLLAGAFFYAGRFFFSTVPLT
jgi:hypothetical protein